MARTCSDANVGVLRTRVQSLHITHVAVFEGGMTGYKE